MQKEDFEFSEGDEDGLAGLYTLQDDEDYQAQAPHSERGSGFPDFPDVDGGGSGEDDDSPDTTAPGTYS